MAEKIMKYSIIVLLEVDEMHKGSVQFIQNLNGFFSDRQEPFEILVVNNGIGELLKDELLAFLTRHNTVKALEFNTKTTKAVCLKTALEETSGEIMVVCGSYQQITNNSLLDLLDSLDSRTDIVTPWRQHRVDSMLNQFQSKLFNALVRKLTASMYHDTSCTVKVFRREVLENVEIYGNMYRFLPILADRRGFKTKEVKCEHYQQHGKSTYYGLPHYIDIFIDIFTLYFNTWFTRKPLRFFSSIGLIFLLAGMLIAAYIFVERLLINHPIGDRPFLLLAILFMVLGVQAASVGLLGEIIAFTHGRHRKEYTIEKII
jgi:glycosyltransferase involved in cell wall biosynthesis